MSFDPPVLIWCIAVPVGIAILASAACWLVVKRSPNIATAPAQRTAPITATILALAWWLAVTLGLIGSSSLAVWTEATWPRMIWPLLGTAMLVSPFANNSVRNPSGTWVLMGGLSVIAAAIAMPSGDGWTDMLPLHRTWIAAITVAATCNALALQRMSLRGADRWLLLVILAGLACPAIIGAATYGALFQSCLAAIVVTMVLAVFAAWDRIGCCAGIIYPSVLFTTTMIASGRFFSYDEVSGWDYGLALFAPGLITVADGLVARRTVVIRVSVCAIVATAIVIYTACRFLIA